MKKLLLLILLLCLKISYAQYTAIPDVNFELALEAYDEFDAMSGMQILDGQVPTANISGLTVLNVANKSISDLTGIEDFAALEMLVVFNNNLTILDVSSNTNLITLTCSANNLIILQLGSNPNLEGLNISQNGLTSTSTSLDLSDVPNLKFVYAHANNLSVLDLSQHVFIEELTLNDNNLERLNIKNGNNNAITTFNASGNANLLCIDVDDETAANAGTGIYGSWVKDAGTNYAEKCFTYVPDDAFEQALIDYNLDTSLNNYVLYSNIKNVQPAYFVSFNSNSLAALIANGATDFTGIEDFEDVDWLIVEGSSGITNFDISANTNLKRLEFENSSFASTINFNSFLQLTNLVFSNCQINSLDVSQLTNLLSISILDNNDISTVDLSNNAQLRLIGLVNCSQLNEITLSPFKSTLTDVYVLNNPQLSGVLDLRNNNPSNNYILSTAQLTGNPNLTCIEVDNETAAMAGTGVYSGWQKDGTAVYSNDCSTLSIEDFELADAVKLYPNPVTNSFKIESNTSISKVEIYSILGEKVLEFDNQLEYNINSLENGIYFINITSNNGKITTTKIIKN